MNAANATWRSSKVGGYPVSIFGTASGACWSGGRIAGEFVGEDWDFYHDDTSGFRWSQPNMTVENIYVSNFGDCTKSKRDGGEATNWTLRGARLEDCHDDGHEDDYLYSGKIVDTLINGTYVGISARASSGQGTDGRNETVTLDHTLLWLKPMQSVYKGDAPGTGGFYKWGGSESPRVAMFDSVFRADQPPNHGTLALPAVPVTCARNVVLWTGAGVFPERASWLAKCPDTRIIEGPTALALWNGARDAWLSHH